jgi:hypothetical protein
MMRITGIPLEVINRALELYGLPPECNLVAAQAALGSAEGRLDATGQYTPLVQAIAEHLMSGVGYEIEEAAQ